MKRRLESQEQMTQDLDVMVEDLRAAAVRQLEALTDLENELKDKDEMLQYVEGEVSELKDKFR